MRHQQLGRKTHKALHSYVLQGTFRPWAPIVCCFISWVAPPYLHAVHLLTGLVGKGSATMRCSMRSSGQALSCRESTHNRPRQAWQSMSGNTCNCLAMRATTDQVCHSSKRRVSSRLRCIVSLWAAASIGRMWLSPAMVFCSTNVQHTRCISAGKHCSCTKCCWCIRGTPYNAIGCAMGCRPPTLARDCRSSSSRRRSCSSARCLRLVARIYVTKSASLPCSSAGLAPHSLTQRCNSALACSRSAVQKDPIQHMYADCSGRLVL